MIGTEPDVLRLPHDSFDVLNNTLFFSSLFMEIVFVRIAFGQHLLLMTNAWCYRYRDLSDLAEPESF